MWENLCRSIIESVISKRESSIYDQIKYRHKSIDFLPIAIHGAPDQYSPYALLTYLIKILCSTQIKNALVCVAFIEPKTIGRYIYYMLIS